MPALDPAVQAALWGGAIALAIKGVDILLGRRSDARAERDELRGEIKRLREERDEAIRQRREAEREALAYHERVVKLADEVDSARNGSGVARQAAEKAVARLTEAEARLEFARGRERELTTMVGVLRARDRELRLLVATYHSVAREHREELRAMGDRRLPLAPPPEWALAGDAPAGDEGEPGG